MWVRYHRVKRHLFVTTNNGLERMNQTFKHDFLKKRTNYTLSNMLRCLVEVFIPQSLAKYAADNLSALAAMQGWQSDDTPDFLLDKMPNFKSKVLQKFYRAHDEFTSEMIMSYTGRKFWHVGIKLPERY